MTYPASITHLSNTYFFTLRLQDRQADMLVQHVDVLRQSVRIAMKRHPFEIRAAVVLPATLHMLWTLPADNQDYARRWRMIKSTFSRHVPAPSTLVVTEAMKRRREKGIWQRGYWAHKIRDQMDYDLHEHLILHAPVTAALVKAPRDWALSSIHFREQGPPLSRASTPMDIRKPQPMGATLF